MSDDTRSDNTQSWNVFGMISPATWPLNKIFKNLSSERDLISTPKAEGVPLKSIKEFKFNDSDKRSAVSISLKLILLQKMAMASDKFPLDNLKKQAHLEFVTLFQSLQNVSLYWIIDGVCWLRVLRAQVFNPKQQFLLKLDIPNGLLNLQNKDSVIDEYYKVLQSRILGTYLDKSPVKKDSRTLKSLFYLLEFMYRGNFIAVLPENFILVRDELTKSSIEITLAFAVLLDDVVILPSIQDTDEVFGNLIENSLLILIYIGQGFNILVDIFQTFNKQFPNRINSLQDELYTKRIVRIDPEDEDGLTKRELGEIETPNFNEKYKDYARKLYFNIG